MPEDYACIFVKSGLGPRVLPTAKELVDARRGCCISRNSLKSRLTHTWSDEVVWIPLIIGVGRSRLSPSILRGQSAIASRRPVPSALPPSAQKYRFRMPVSPAHTTIARQSHVLDRDVRDPPGTLHPALIRTSARGLGRGRWTPVRGARPALRAKPKDFSDAKEDANRREPPGGDPGCHS